MGAAIHEEHGLLLWLAGLIECYDEAETSRTRSDFDPLEIGALKPRQ